MAIIKVDGIEDIKYLDKMVNKGSFGKFILLVMILILRS